MTMHSAILLTAAVSASLGVANAGTPSPETNPYVAGDMHNHNTCQDGSVAAGYAIDRSVGTGTDALGGKNFNLDWFTLGNHGGSGNRDCRFSDTSANIPGQTTHFWINDLGLTVDGITVNALKGTPNGGNMWQWQAISEVEWPYIVNRTAEYKKVLIEGLEWKTPGHEHTDVAVITGQTKKTGANANANAEFEFRFDFADNDAIGPVDATGAPIWTGKDNVNNSGDAGHQKAVSGIRWLQANHAVRSYAIPTHSERQGPYNPTGKKGYNIEHFRDFNNAGPTVAFGIESPGHAAQGGLAGGSGSYESNAVGGGTYGMWGIYTAKIGGLWDGLLGEGRNVFSFESSDWHNRGSFGARDAQTTSDFFPGEYANLFVRNAEEFKQQNVIDGMRSGNTYSVNGNLIGADLVYVISSSHGSARMGQTLEVTPGEKLTLKVSFSVPLANNSPYTFNNPLLLQDGIRQPLNKPSVDHLDLIRGDVTGVIAPGAPGYAVPNAGGPAGAAIVYNPTAALWKQVSAGEMRAFQRENGRIRYVYETRFTAGAKPGYIRLRGTNIPVATPNVTDANGNPLIDISNSLVACTDAACPAHLAAIAGKKMVTYDVQAWSNLWFYANPIFMRPAGTPKLLVEKNAELARKLRETIQSDDGAGG